VTQSQVQELRYLNGEASSPVARGGRGGLSARNSAAVAGDYPGPRGHGTMMRCVDCIGALQTEVIMSDSSSCSRNH